MSNIIFLDIDGVLNDLERQHWTVSDYQPEITPRCVQAFNRIVLATEAVIVLSSSWRYQILNGHMSRHGFQTLLKSHGVRGHLVSHTRADVEEGEAWEPRWRQISDWLKAPVSPVSRYCILDDDPDAFGGRPGVQTAGGIGLTEADADAAIAILNRKAPQ